MRWAEPGGVRILSRDADGFEAITTDVLGPYLEPDASRAYQHQEAGNDPSGNPQRLYVVYQREGAYWRTVAVHDEGYRGRPDELRYVSELPSVTIPKSEYHERIRAARSKGILHE